MNRIAFILFLFIGTLSNLYAQSESDQEILTKWKNASQYTINMIDSMPAEHFDFRATPDVKMFREQITHMVDNMIWLSTDYLGGEKFEKSEPKTKEEHIEYMRSACAHAGLVMEAALKDSTILNTQKDFFAGPMTGRQIIRLMHDHVTHHRGQMIIYLRLKGIKPARYFGW